MEPAELERHRWAQRGTAWYVEVHRRAQARVCVSLLDAVGGGVWRLLDGTFVVNARGPPARGVDVVTPAKVTEMMCREDSPRG